MSEFIKMKLSEARAKFEQIDELKGNQHKIDANKNGKVDAHDFKLLRGKNKVAEEVEDLDEISKPTLGRYINKAKNSIDLTAWRQGHKEADVAANPKHVASLGKKLDKRHRGIETAVKKLTKEDAEQIDELSKDTMGRYINKAATKMGSQGVTAGLKIAADEKSSKNFKDMGKREKGIKLAVNKLTKEEAEELDELSKGTLNSYVIKSLAPSSEKSISNLASKGGFEQGERGDTDSSAGEKEDAKAVKRSLGVLTAVRKLAKEESEGCMTDTSMGGADQIAQSKTGEIYKKSGKSGDAMNATSVNKRVPAVESAVLDVMAKTFEKRKMFEDASNITIISPEQRQDWLNVSTGSMEVVDYFNKYKV
jgi:hypothetical protein